MMKHCVPITCLLIILWLPHIRAEVGTGLQAFKQTGHAKAVFPFHELLQERAGAPVSKSIKLAIRRKKEIRGLVQSQDSKQLSIIREAPVASFRGSLLASPSKIEVSEGGRKAILSVRADAAVPVSIPIVISAEPEGQIRFTPSHLNLTPDNWHRDQQIVVEALNDQVADGDIRITLNLQRDIQRSEQYLHIEALKVPVLVKDRDAAEIEIGDYKGFTQEDGAETDIPMRLRSKPRAPVSITFSVSKPTEAKLEKKRLTFTPENWYQAQTIRVIGINDAIQDGDKAYRVIFESVESEDASYQQLEVAPIELINRETSLAFYSVESSSKDVALEDTFLGISGTPAELPDLSPVEKELSEPNQKADLVIRSIDMNSSESGRVAVAELTLAVKPNSDVVVTIRSDDNSEGVVETDRLIFTDQSWNTPQAVRCRGVDDAEMDGDIAYRLILKAESDRDLRYSRLPQKQLQLHNLDDDQAGFRVILSQTGTSEAGKKIEAGISLSSRPLAPVSLSVKSSDENEVVVRPSSLRFTDENWQEQKFVSIVGVDDAIADGDKSVTISVQPLQSEDAGYRNMQAETVTVVNRDNDTASLIVIADKTITGETGSAAHVWVRLGSEPIRPVLIDIASSNPQEGMPRPKKLTFNATDWKTGRRMEIAGQDDDVNDGDINYRISFSSRRSSDPSYQALPDQYLGMVNEDDDIAGLWLGPLVGQTTENRDRSVFNIRLKSKPMAPVQLSISSSNPMEGKVINKTLSFTPENWSSEQSVQISGVDDIVADGDTAFEVIIQTVDCDDPRYRILDPVSLSLVNKDNDTAGFRITSPRGSTSENGDSASFSIALNSKPSHPVRVDLSSADPSEGITGVASVSFDPEYWEQPKAVTVTGVNDQQVDGEQSYKVILKPAISKDPAYDGIDPEDVTISNLDNNLTTFFVSKVRGNTSEAGEKASFSIRLNTKPIGRVKIAVHSDRPKEAIPDLESLLFDKSNWDQNRKVMVIGLDDDVDDGDKPYHIIVTSSSETDPAFNDIPPVKLKLVNQDDDQAGVQVKTINTMSAENGDEAQFSVRLTSKPRSAVVLLFKSSRPGEARMIVQHAAFQTGNWDKERVIRIKGIPDYLVDGNQKYAIINTGVVSGDPQYNGLPFQSLNFVNKDVDQARFIISPVSGDTTESGGTASFTVRLSSKPRAPVSIQLQSSNLQEAMIDKNQLQFDESNWSREQLVTMTGVDDYIKDENKPYRVVFSSSVSDDPNFHGITPPWVSLKNLDNKSLTLGLYSFYGLPMEEFADEFDDGFGVQLTTGWVLTGHITLIGGYRSYSMQGSPRKSLYGDTHVMQQELALNSIIIGLKIVVMKQPLQLFTESCFSMISWKYDSQNKSDGTSQSDEGQDIGLRLRAGIDYPLTGNLFLETGIGIWQLTGGLGQRQLVSAGAGLYFPF